MKKLKRNYKIILAGLIGTTVNLIGYSSSICLVGKVTLTIIFGGFVIVLAVKENKSRSPFFGDTGLHPLETIKDNSATGIIITGNPYEGYVKSLVLNTTTQKIGESITDSACYFSNNGGTTALKQGKICKGAMLYWNGSKAGFQLEKQDTLDIYYDQ